MKSRRFGTTLMLAALLATMAHTAPAGTVVVVAVPPFGAGVGVSSLTLKAPCVRKPSPVSSLKPAPSAGRIDSSAGLNVRGCELATMSRSDYLSIGDVAPALQGRKADLVAVLSIDDLRLVESGSGALRSAHLAIAMGRKFDAASPLLGIECAATCTRVTPSGPGGSRSTITVTRTVASLPPTLWMSISSDATLRKATGSVGVELRASIVSLAIRPA